MTDYKVSITIDSDNKPAIQKIDQVGKRVRDIEGDARRGFGGANREASGFQRGLGNLQSVVIGLGTAFVTQIGIQGVMAMRQLGDEISFARQRFEALTGGADTAALDALRKATGGVITDYELMKTTTSAIMTGIAKDAQEAGELIALGMSLGGEEGVEKLFQALRNQSFLVLDNIGISASAVRELAEQYKAAGMASADAFNRAVYEVGVQTREQLGDAANAGITAWARVKTWFENEFARAAEGVAGFLELAAQDLITAIEAHNLYWSTRAPLIQGGAMQTNAPVDMPFSGISGGLGAFDPASAGPYGTGTTAINVALERERMIRAMINREQAQADAQRIATERVLASLADYRAQRERERLERNFATPEHFARANELYGQAYDVYFGVRQAFGMDTRRRMGQPLRFTPAEAAQFGDFSELLKPVEDIRRAIAEAREGGLVHPDQLTLMEGILNTAEGVADEAKRAQDAFVAMTSSLSGLLGTDSADRVGTEITDAVVRGMRDRGMSDEKIDEYLNMMDLSTGRQTELSQRFQTEVIPGIARIAEEQGTEAAAAATQAFQRGLTMSRVNAWRDPDDLLRLMGWYEADDGTLKPTGLGVVPDNVGTMGMTPSSTPGPAVSPFTPLIAEVDTLSSKINMLSVESLPLLAGAITPATEEMGKVRDVGGEVQGILDTMSSKEYPLKFALTASDTGLPAWLKQAIRDELVVLNRANGGSVPGADPRRVTRTAN